jgi:hypothetical protein
MKLFVNPQFASPMSVNAAHCLGWGYCFIVVSIA